MCIYKVTSLPLGLSAASGLERGGHDMRPSPLGVGGRDPSCCGVSGRGGGGVGGGGGGGGGFITGGGGRVQGSSPSGSFSMSRCLMNSWSSGDASLTRGMTSISTDL